MSEICTNKNSPVFAGLFFIIVEVGGIESQLLPRRHLARSRPRLARFVYSRNMSAAFNSPTQSAQALCSLPFKKQKRPKGANVFTSGSGENWRLHRQVLFDPPQGGYRKVFQFSRASEEVHSLTSIQKTKTPLRASMFLRVEVGRIELPCKRKAKMFLQCLAVFVF